MAPSHRRRAKTRLYETGGTGGAGRLIERWGFLWRWETWVSDAPLARRPRGGWTLTYAGALKASEDALQDYDLKAGEQDALPRRFERGGEQAEAPEIGSEVPPRRGSE